MAYVGLEAEARTTFDLTDTRTQQLAKSDIQQLSWLDHHQLRKPIIHPAREMAPRSHNILTNNRYLMRSVQG